MSTAYARRATVLEALETWQTHMQACAARMHELRALVGSEPESPLLEAVSGLKSGYTAAVSVVTGIDSEWLEVWWLEHAFGAKPMRAGLQGEALRTITTLDALVDLILADQATEEDGHAVD